MGYHDPRWTRRAFLKRSAAAGGALAVPSLLTARGVTARSVSSRSARQEAGTTIRYNAVALPESDYIQNELLPQFTDETGIAVEVESTDYVRLHDKQVLDLQSDRYDVYQVDQIWLQAYAKSGFLEALDGYLTPEFVAAFYPNLMEIGNQDGKQWVLPFSAIPVDYYYRKDILEAEGLEPGDTWDDVLSIAQATAKDGRYGFAVRGERGNPITWTWLPMLWSFGGLIFDEQYQPVYNSPEGIASVEFFKQLNTTSAPGWLSAQDVAAMLQQDKATQTTLMSFLNGAMDDPDASQVVGLVEFGEMPMKETRATILGMWTLGIATKSTKKDAAWQFVEFLLRPEIHTQMSLAGVVTPAQPAVYADPNAPRYFPTLGKVLEYAYPPPLIPEAEDWFLITGTELQNALSGVKTPQLAMDDAAQQVRDLMSSAGYYG